MVERFLLSVQHSMNPLHVYCRLRDRGMDPHWSRLLSRVYEIALYGFILIFTRHGIALCQMAQYKPGHDSHGRYPDA